jgi:hypothetical protein
MGLPDKQLKVLIKSALKEQVTVTPQQKQLAWDRLSEKVKEQSILPAKLTAAEQTLPARFIDSCGIFWHQFSTFATQEDRYERARLNRSLLKYNGFSDKGEIVLQFLEPLRMTI